MLWVALLVKFDAPKSFKENFRHHAFVFVIEKMAVEERHASDDGIGEVHNDVDGSPGWHVYGVQPHGMLWEHSIFGISQEMHLMDMHGVQLPGFVENAPMLVTSDAHTRHRSRFRCVLLVVDIEAVRIFSKGHDEIGL